MRILLTGAGGPSAISVWKSLGAQHALFMADMDPCASGLYLVPAVQRLIVPRGDAPDFVDLVFELCQRLQIELLISTVDAELVPLARARARFESLGVALPLSPLPALALCADKGALLEAARGVVAVPDFTPWRGDTTLAGLPFPRFVKPRRGAGGRGAAVVRSAADLQLLPQDGSYLLQEWLPGDEYSVDVYLRADGEALAAVPRVRMKIDSGIAVAARTVQHPALCQAAIDVARAVGVRHVANVQFREAADGQPKLLEINPRFPGTLPLTQRAGIDLPALLVEEMSGRPLAGGLRPFQEVMAVRFWAEQFLDPQEWAQLCPR